MPETLDPVSVYHAWRASMGSHADEIEAKLMRRWRRFKRDALEDGAQIRATLYQQLKKQRIRGGVLSPDTFNVAPFRVDADKAIWQWQAKEFRRLRLWPGGRGKKNVEVFNRLWDYNRGGPRDMVDMARDVAGNLSRDPTLPLPKATRRKIQEAIDKADLDGNAASWADNVVRAIEQASHQASMSIVDATSGLNTESALRETVTKFAVPLGVLQLSFTTHGRAAYRSCMAATGRAAQAEHYVYYLPAEARVAADPNGFGAEHYAQIRHFRKWEALRRGMKRKRPGSYIFTTGFHVGDRGYLLPIPPQFLKEAQEVERRKRQRWLEGIRDKAS